MQNRLVNTSMKTQTLPQRTPSQRFIRCLFGSVFALQALDFHSTFIALNERHETNKFILLLSQTVGLSVSIFIAKTLAVLSLVYLARTWSRTSGFDAPVAVALSTMCLGYVFVVVSNYAG
jgi:hypothetical protein